jgi:hypothetical protein
MTVSKLIIITLFAWFLNACSFAPPSAQSYTVISDQPDKLRKHYVPVGTSVKSKDCFTSIFIHLIWFGTPPVGESMLMKVLEEHNADALIDAEFEYSLDFFPYIFSHSCLTVSGTPVKFKEAK